MLVTFHTKAYADITMFGNVAVKLLKLMGHSGTVPSAIRPGDIPAALERLRAGLEIQPAPSPDDADRAKDSGEPIVSFEQRAFPLIELLEAAEQAQASVMWDS